MLQERASISADNFKIEMGKKMTFKEYREEQPVIVWGITSGTIIALTAATITVLQVAGITNMSDELIAAIIALASIVLSIITSAVAHNRTTPMSNPKLDDGTPLIPETPAIKAFVEGQ